MTINPAPLPAAQPAAARCAAASRAAAKQQIFNRRLLLPLLIDSLKKFSPLYLWRNPVLLLTEAGAVLTSVYAIVEGATGSTQFSGGSQMPPGFSWALASGFWVCLFTATLAEAIAEGRGRAQTASLHKLRATGSATRVLDYDPKRDRAALHTQSEIIDSHKLQVGDIVIVAAGEIIPADGEVLWGEAEVDESGFTGQAQPVIHAPAGDRTAVTGGTRDLSDRIVLRVTQTAATGQVESTIRLAARLRRKRAPLEIAFNALLASFSLSFLVMALTLNPVISPDSGPVSIPVLTAVVICLIPTEIAALLSVTGIAGMHQLLKRGVLVMSAKALETAGDIDTVLLDKTGTVTHGNRSASEFLPLGDNYAKLLQASLLASLHDPTPEGASTVALATQMRENSASSAQTQLLTAAAMQARAIPFSASTRISGIDLPDGTRIRKGAVSAVIKWLQSEGCKPERAIVQELKKLTHQIATAGGTPLVVATKLPTGAAQALGLIHLTDKIKSTVPAQIARLHQLGVKSVLVTGDHQLTAQKICAQTGIDDFVGDAAPAAKLQLLSSKQAAGHLVAMSGDGINDAPALAQADIGIAMNTATVAAKAAANMIILDDDPAHLSDIITVGRRQMATRGALLMFNFANDVVRYFTLFPALLVGIFPGLAALNILGLHSPASAILDTVIYSSLVMGVMLPLALIGVPYRVTEVKSALTRNLILNTISGIMVPVLLIKLIDLLVSQLPGY